MRDFYQKALKDPAWEIDLDDPEHLPRVGKWMYWTEFMVRNHLTPAQLELFFNNILALMSYPETRKLLEISPAEQIDLDNVDHAGILSFYAMMRLRFYDQFDANGFPLEKSPLFDKKDGFPQKAPYIWDIDCLTTERLARTLFLQSDKMRPRLERYYSLLKEKPVTLNPKDRASAGIYGFWTEETLMSGQDEAKVMAEFDSKINIRPRQGNRSKSVEDPARQKVIRDVVRSLMQ